MYVDLLQKTWASRAFKKEHLLRILDSFHRPKIELKTRSRRAFHKVIYHKAGKDARAILALFPNKSGSYASSLR